MILPWQVTAFAAVLAIAGWSFGIHEYGRAESADQRCAAKQQQANNATLTKTVIDQGRQNAADAKQQQQLGEATRHVTNAAAASTASLNEKARADIQRIHDATPDKCLDVLVPDSVLGRLRDSSGPATP